LKRYVQHPINCQCGRCNNTAGVVIEDDHILVEEIKEQPSVEKERDTYKATLEHIAKGRCSNPRQCAQEALDGDWKVEGIDL
jgi:hypothetical protein